MILEGFLEEEKVEDGGLGLGALSRDLTVGKCPLYLVTGEIVGFQKGFGWGGVGGRRTCQGGLAWQALALRAGE